jgi:hypothetical protein
LIPHDLHVVKENET